MTLYSKTFRIFDRNFMGYSTMGIILQSCLGAIAAMYILMNGTAVSQMIQLAIVVITCILVNTSVLAQMKHKVTFNGTLLSVVLSVLFIIVNSLI